MPFFIYVKSSCKAQGRKKLIHDVLDGKAPPKSLAYLFNYCTPFSMDAPTHKSPQASDIPVSEDFFPKIDLN